jgi:hypothetical protein
MGGNDLLHASLGDDTIDGGADTDIVVFTGNLDDYALVEAPDGTVTVTRKDGNGTALLKNTEFARFDDLQVDLITGEETVVGGRRRMSSSAPRPLGRMRRPGRRSASCPPWIRRARGFRSA